MHHRIGDSTILSRLLSRDGAGLLAAAVVLAVAAVVREVNGESSPTLFVLAVVFTVIGLAKARRGNERHRR